MTEDIFIYFIGPAGSGKSTLTQGLNIWMDRLGYDAVTVNLDPGAERMPYSPDIDVRDWINMYDVMDKYNLGPNGAQIVCADMLALKVQDLKETIEGYQTNYFLMDTPGQMELFTFRECSKAIIDTLGREKSFIVFLFDSVLSNTPSGFISLFMMSATIQIRLQLPLINVLSKTDLIDEIHLKEILAWSENPDALYDKLISESPTMHSHLNQELLKTLDEMALQRRLIPISANNLTGIEDIYNSIQLAIMGGEDLASD